MGVGGRWGVHFCWMQFCNGHGIAALHFCASALLRTVVRCTILRCRAVRCTFERCRAFRDALFSWGGSPVQLQTAFPDHQHQIWKMVIAHRDEDVSLVVSVRWGHQLFCHFEFLSPKVIRLPHTLPALDEISILIWTWPTRPTRPTRLTWPTFYFNFNLGLQPLWFYVSTP